MVVDLNKIHLFSEFRDIYEQTSPVKCHDQFECSILWTKYINHHPNPFSDSIVYFQNFGILNKNIYYQLC